MRLKTIEKLNLKNKIMLLRVNFDVPIKNGKVSDDSRILAHLPTIKFLLAQKAKIILISHLGRPKFPPKADQPLAEKIKKQFNLEPVYDYLKFKIKNLKFINTWNRGKIKLETEKLKPGEIILLENLRFNKEEEKNDKKFAKFLANLADVYINDAFAVSHRDHASISAITKYLPSYAGLLLEKEIKNLNEIKNNPKHPFIVLMGGAKISTKIPVLKKLCRKADKILIGGALANDLLKLEGYQVGESLVEKEKTQLSLELKKKMVLPVDVVIKSKLKTQNLKVTELNELRSKDFKILDIGEETIKNFAKYLQSAKMIIWNGPMGLFEERPFDQGTEKLLKKILKNKKAKIVFGGGETLACLKLLGSSIRLSKNIFISTGGGAMLEFLEGKILPGIKPLLKK